MGYSVTVIADSISPAGARITTMQLRFPRFLLAEFNTHRVFSRNARSSRAVPIRKILKEAEADPVIPVSWGFDEPGMRSTSEMDIHHVKVATQEWMSAKDRAVDAALELMDTGVHKQIVNRILEPFMWVDVVVTSTSYDNFFRLRCNAEAQPEMQKLAVMMARAYRDSEPCHRRVNRDWHLPYIDADDLWELADEDLVKVSAARCARVSYKAHDGKTSTVAKDIELHDKLMRNGHASPFEHQARCLEDGDERSGNFTGWSQYRQTLILSGQEKFDFSILDRDFGDRDYITPK